MNQPMRVPAQTAPPEAVTDAAAEEPVHADTRSLGFLVNDVARLIRNGFAQRVQEAGLGLTGGEARALVHVAAAAGARQNEIAERMGVEPMTLCGYIDKLEGRGLVERQPHPDDRRAKRVVPTAEAEEAMGLIMPVAQAMIDEMLDGLPQEDVDALYRALTHIQIRLSPRPIPLD